VRALLTKQGFEASVVQEEMFQLLKQVSPAPSPTAPAKIFS
jgi:hypothetical protein